MKKMKKIIILILFIGFFVSGCKKDPDVVSKVVEVTYPSIVINGSLVVYVPVGGSYTELGAVLTDDITGASTTISPTESNIDFNTPGLYKVSFTAKNTNGFKTSVYRTVLVMNYTPPVGLDPNFDISGLYQRTNGIYVNLYKVDNGLYVIDNFAGSSTVYPAILLTPDTVSIDIPAQESFDGFALDVTSETYTTTPAIKFSYRVAAKNFGTSVRTFIKQ